jgi:hypothetical protein
MVAKQKWMQRAFKQKNKGKLHRQLGISVKQRIPKGLLAEIHRSPVGSMVQGHRVTLLLKERVGAVVNASKRRKKR